VAHARNLGAHTALGEGAELLVFLDVDCIPAASLSGRYRQVTADKSHGALPGALQNLSLYEPYGPLVAGNRGVIEFSDLLKRPLEHYKYLLTTVERAALSMTSTTLFLDLAFIGSSNDIHLAAFREIPDFQSFKGRIELVRVPFALDRAISGVSVAVKLPDGRELSDPDVIVDDVLYTGRTVRAALDECADFGRPKRILLCVLIDRGGRELPIQADVVGTTISTAPGDRVDVFVSELDGRDAVEVVRGK